MFVRNSDCPAVTRVGKPSFAKHKTEDKMTSTASSWSICFPSWTSLIWHHHVPSFHCLLCQALQWLMHLTLKGEKKSRFIGLGKWQIWCPPPCYFLWSVLCSLLQPIGPSQCIYIFIHISTLANAKTKLCVKRKGIRTCIQLYIR